MPQRLTEKELRAQLQTAAAQMEEWADMLLAPETHTVPGIVAGLRQVASDYRALLRTTRTAPRCDAQQPVDFCEPRGAAYRCTLPVGHTGAHVMTTHPMHPAWE